MDTVTARANANIAFIKYWGNRNESLRLPVNSSISMNLNGLFTETSVTWDTALQFDTLVLNGTADQGKALDRVAKHLQALRDRLGIVGYARVESSNNFPMGAGIASSAASFAALTVAAVGSAHLTLTEPMLSALARLGSGSAARSIPTGFAEWYASDDHDQSYAVSVAPPDYWNLVDVVAVISGEHKPVGSTQGHQSAGSSDLQSARVAGASARLEQCRKAILERDFGSFAEVVELDSNLMHAVMMTSRPPLFYWLPVSLTVMKLVSEWRAEGLDVCYTLDAGPNVHCICTQDSADEVRSRLSNVSGVREILVAAPGAGATII